jgi:hypothetical protein
MFIYFGLDMHHTLSHFTISIVTCYILLDIVMFISLVINLLE